MAVASFTFPYTGSPPYFSGAAASSLVPSVFPVAIDGRAYMIDQKSGRFARSYEQRIRDSQDISTAPGESSINPGGLWRRGQDSWHFGAGQQYADAAESKDYRFYKSKGIDIWTKGQLSLLNATKVAYTQTGSTANVRVVSTDTAVFVTDGSAVKYSTAPFTFITATVSNVSAAAGTVTYTTSAAHGFTAGQTVSITGVVPTAYNLTDVTIAATPTTTTFTVTNAATGTFVSGGTATQYPVWTAVSGLPALTPRDIVTDGTNVFLTYAGTTNAYGIWKINSSYAAANYAYGHEFGEIGYAKGRLITGAAYLPAVPYGEDIYYDPIGNVGGDSDEVKIPLWEWIGFAGGQGAIYAAGHAGDKSVIFKITITTAGVLDKLVAALELPKGEIVSAIHGYLGYILIGTNKGVRYCTSDDNLNLVAGPLIPTSGPVYGFTAEDKYVWFTWSNYDGVSGGLGRMDLSAFTSTNAPAYATDLMYNSTGDVLSCTTFSNRRLFTIKGVGLVVEDTANVVTSGEIETGIWRWGIPDRKFVAKVDTRATPLVGSISQYLKIDEGDWIELGVWDEAATTENSINGTDDKAIEAAFKFKMTRSAGANGPTMTRWMARAYVAPFRSQQFVIPILLHDVVKVRDKEYYYDVEEHQSFFDGLIESPRIITLQIGSFTHTVIVDDVEWTATDAHGTAWSFQGTLVVTLRSVEN